MKFFMRCLFPVFWAFFIFLAADGMSIAATPNPLCDAGLWDKINQRAHLQGQMDVARTENLIYRADSVLEYTCFNRFMIEAEKNMPYYFKPDFVDNYIQPMVKNYLFKNFPHTFLGGRTAAAAADTTVPTDYDCDAMQTVWNTAKCMNLESLMPQDALTTTMAFINADDIRKLPTACVAPDKATFGILPVTDVAVALPADVTAITDCGSKIPTGNIIDLSSTTDSAYVNKANLSAAFPAIPGRKYQEFICSNPACNYKPTGYAAGTCNMP